MREPGAHKLMVTVSNDEKWKHFCSGYEIYLKITKIKCTYASRLKSFPFKISKRLWKEKFSKYPCALFENEEEKS